MFEAISNSDDNNSSCKIFVPSEYRSLHVSIYWHGIAKHNCMYCS